MHEHGQRDPLVQYKTKASEMFQSLMGEVRSGAGDRAIAMLRLDAVRGGGALTAGNTRLEASIPGWMRLPEVG